MTKKTYGQYCGLAKALDHVGDRWTLLIIRELLVKPQRYSSLREALPGIATNLLGDRLSDLIAEGLADKTSDGTYELTAEGKALEETVHALVRWGGRWMLERGREEFFRPQWLVIALRALLPSSGRGLVELHVEGEVLHIGPHGVDIGRLESSDATIEGSAEEVLAVAAGLARISSLKVRGDRKVAKAVLEPSR